MRQYLKDLRLKKGLSQTVVSEKIGITQSYYNMIESGQRQEDMSLSLIDKLAEVFDVSVLYIVEQEKMIKKIFSNDDFLG